MSSEFVLLLLCRFWCSGTSVSQIGRTDDEHGFMGRWCFNSESSMVATLVGPLLLHTAQLFPFTGIPCFLWAEHVSTLDAVKSLMMSFLQTGNLSGVDGRLSYAGDRRARWKWSSSEKRLRRCYYPCKPKVGWVTPYIISGCSTWVKCIIFFFPWKYAGENRVPEWSDKRWETAHGSSFIALNGRGRRKFIWSKSICNLA